MAVRSIKLKLKTKSGESSLPLRLGLWKTHELFNDGVAYYMRQLILIRQDSYHLNSPNGVQLISNEEVQEEIIKKVREQQVNNGWQGESGADTEILSLLRQLYELLVPSAIGAKGDSQSLSRKFLSPLVDPESEGGKGIAKAGRKPRWKKMQEDGDPKWEQEFEKDKAKKEQDPTSSILTKLEEIGLKPLFDLYTDTRSDIQWLPKGSRQYVRTLDRDMFQQSLERMLSWESWNCRVRDEKEKLQQKMQEFNDKYLSENNEWIGSLRIFEDKRQKELAEEALEPIDKYLITKRQVRGWDRVYDKWSRMPVTASKGQLLKTLAELQSKMKGEFGDPQVFRFLAEEKNRHIWQGKPQRLLHFAAYNGLLNKLRYAKEQANFTLPDPIKHPLWIRYDARGGNIHHYVLEEIDPKNYKVKFDMLLWPEKDSWIEKREVEILLAPSKQFNRQIKLCNNPHDRQQVIFYDYSSRAELTGTLGGSKIQFDREHLEKRSDKVAEGEIGSVYLNLVVDLDPLLPMKNGRLQTPLGQILKVLTNGTEYPKVITYDSEKLNTWVQESEISKKHGIASLQEGFRIMSVDMGQRTSAAVSIFEVVKETSQIQSKIIFPIGDTGMFAIHRRSLLLNLPGEAVSNQIKQIRDERWKNYLAVRAQVRLLSRVLKLHKYTSDADRLEGIQELLQGLDNSKIHDDHKSIWRRVLLDLLERKESSAEEWKRHLERSHHQLEELVGQVMSTWRKSLSQKRGSGIERNPRQNIAGISLWNIEELNNTRKILVSWSKHSRVAGEINRIQSDEKFGKKLLHHTQNVKDNRLKQMANLIVMTALGYKYNEKQKQWIDAYPACQMVLFENLKGYKLDQERSRRENSKLMSWAHRSIPKLVHMQGELFGLQVGDVYAAYSSRYYAKTGAPGIRCHALTIEDIARLNNEGSLYPVAEDQYFEGMDLKKFVPGDLVPSKGGELFVTINVGAKNDLAVIHADINAAQNLQKRFWQQGNEIFRIPCQRAVTKDGNVYVPSTGSKKVKELLGKGCFVSSSFDPNVYIWQENPKIVSKKTSDESFTEEEMVEVQEMLEEAQELTGEYKTLLRDPSGVFWTNDLWLPQKEFWARVNSKIKKILREKVMARTLEV